MRISALLLTLGVVSCSTNPVLEDRYALKLSELRTTQSITEFKERGWTTFIEDTAQGTTNWTFTPDSHPAHPSFASRRFIRNRDASLSVRTILTCGAPKKHCVQLKYEYDLLDAQLKNQVGKGRLLATGCPLFRCASTSEYVP